MSHITVFSHISSTVYAILIYIFMNKLHSISYLSVRICSRILSAVPVLTSFYTILHISGVFVNTNIAAAKERPLRYIRYMNLPTGRPTCVYYSWRYQQIELF